MRYSLFPAVLAGILFSTAGGRCTIRYGERMIEFDTVAMAPARSMLR